jgi:hypothetical protein
LDEAKPEAAVPLDHLAGVRHLRAD